MLMIGNCAIDTLTPIFAMIGMKEEKAKASTHTTDLVRFLYFRLSSLSSFFTLGLVSFSR